MGITYRPLGLPASAWMLVLPIPLLVERYWGSCFWHYASREKGVVEIESEWTARDRELQASGGAARAFLLPG